MLSSFDRVPLSCASCRIHRHCSAKFAYEILSCLHIFADLNQLMALQVIGTGLGRTGTYSLKLALEHIGFGKCFHMLELFQKPEEIRHFKRAERGLGVNWKSVFSSYRSVVDYPAARYYKQITDSFPDAKIIHSYRDPDEWYNSAMQTIFWVNRMPLSMIAKFGMYFPFRKEIRRRLPVLMYNRKLMHLEFGKDLFNRQEVISRYNMHTENVLKQFSDDRILLFNAKDGWEPLCRFLNVELPEVPFPHFNKRTEFQGKVEVIGKGGFLPEDVLV